jgi:hypothetical protein
MVSEHYGCNTSRTTLFSKTYGEETLIWPYKDYSSLLSAFTFFNLLFCSDAPTKR